MKIPKNKRDSFTFISNLQEVTASEDYPISFKRNGYLLSEYYTNDFYEALAKEVKKRRNLLISDNGNFSRMASIAKDFIPEADLLLDQFQDEKIKEEAAKKERQKIVKKIIIHCQKELEQQNKSKIIENQLKINPDYLIALEDFVIPVMMMCGLFHPLFKPEHSEIVEFQLNSIVLYQNLRAGAFGNQNKLKNVQKFHVLHSYDFASAKNGASLIKDFKPDGVAISFGGAMSSRQWISEWDLGDQPFLLAHKLPEMYLATASISLGYIKGNPKNTPIHVLGIGSPILVALLGYLFSKSKAVSIDSTAPFKDANQSKIYGSQYGFIKMNMFKVAALALIEDRPYQSNTPFFKDFEKAFPSDWAALRKKLGVTSNTDAKKLEKILEKEKALVEKFIPFFTKMRSGKDPLIQHLRVARSGHNYWIIHRICESIKRRKHDQEKLKKWMDYQVKRYKKYASPAWAETVEIIFKETSKRFS